MNLQFPAIDGGVRPQTIHIIAQDRRPDRLRSQGQTDHIHKGREGEVRSKSNLCRVGQARQNVKSTTDTTRYPYNAPRDAIRPVSVGW